MPKFSARSKIEIIRTIPKAFWQNRSWYIKRFSWYPFTLFSQVVFALYHPQIKTPYDHRWGGTFTGEAGDWYWDQDDLLRIRKSIISKAVRSRRYVDCFLKNFLRHYENFKKKLTDADKIDLSKLSNERLLRWYEDLFYAEAGVAAWGYIADAFLSSGSKNWLSEAIEDELGGRNGFDVAKITEILTAPAYHTFVNEERLSLLELGRAANRIKLVRKLQKHRENFYWIENDYWIVHDYPVAYFAKKLSRLKQEGTDFEKMYALEQARVAKNIAEKRKAYKKYRISETLRNKVYCSDVFGRIQDCRKEIMLRTDHFLFKFIKQFSRRTRLKENLALNLISPEIRDALLFGKIEMKELARRAEKCFIYYSPKGYAILSGARARAIRKSIFYPKGTSVAGKLEGMPAYGGLVQGKVRVVNYHSDMIKFAAGEILVTNNTTPEFVPLMKKAKAIITEQGGITNHAAIVSRELRKPCIVGIKNITKVLKTGDFIEVDADKGVVSKISNS